MKKMLRRIAIVAAVLSVLGTNYVFACSAVYVGKKASTDGTTIIARSEDTHPCYSPKRLEYVSKKSTSGIVYQQVTNKFKYKLPNVTYDYNCVPNQTKNTREEGRFASVANNEMGVNLSATVTGYVCKEALKADPAVPDGIMEEGITDIIAATSKTAREGVERLADIVDEYGSAENNIIMITDQKESWYMEIYMGHQYAAVKLPEDMVAAFGNEFMLGDVKDYEDYIVSADFYHLPEKNDFAVYDNDGHMLAAETYGGKNRLADYANLRTWYGHYLFAPSTAGEYMTMERYPLTFKPDKKVSVADVMSYFRSRYEGTRYADAENTDKMRMVGTETQTSVHIVQNYDKLPADRSALTWVCMAQAESSVFVPVFAPMHQFEPEYSYDSEKAECNLNSAYYILKSINTLVANNRVQYKDQITKYWKAAEAKMISETAAIMKESADMKAADAKKIQEAYGRLCEKQAMIDAKTMLSDILVNTANNADTLKYAFNYNTLTMSPVKNEPVKFELSLDASKVNANYQR